MVVIVVFVWGCGVVVVCVRLVVVDCRRRYVGYWLVVVFGVVVCVVG